MVGRGRKARLKTERRATAGGRFAAGAPRRERGKDAVFRDEATRRGSAADGAGGRALSPGGRDEVETYDPSAKTCHARAISPPTAERTASGRARIRQDSPPTAYMHTPSGAEDAEDASPGAGVPLRRNRPHADKALNMNATQTMGRAVSAHGGIPDATRRRQRVVRRRRTPCPWRSCGEPSDSQTSTPAPRTPWPQSSPSEDRGGDSSRN